MLTFGQLVPAWDSEYYSFLMCQNIPYKTVFKVQSLSDDVFRGCLSYSITSVFIFWEKGNDYSPGEWAL
jgi:hypothetical protein